MKDTATPLSSTGLLHVEHANVNLTGTTTPQASKAVKYNKKVPINFPLTNAARVYDSRPTRPLAHLESRAIQVAGVGGVPADAKRNHERLRMPSHVSPAIASVPAMPSSNFPDVCWANHGTSASTNSR